MVIGIDASRAFIEDRTGTENYSLELIRAILKLKKSRKHRFKLYVRAKAKVDVEIKKNRQVEMVEIKWPRLWTQGGLAVETWLRPPDVLFVPAHTLPVLRKPGLKTVVTIHGLEYEFLPEYYQWPQKLWLNKSTEYAVRQADKLIAVSEWTKKQLIERLGAKAEKIRVIYEGIGGRIMVAKDRQFKPDYLRQISHKYGLPKDYILFVGTIQPRKNLVRLIEAFSKVYKGPSFVKKDGPYLVIAGKLGWMYQGILATPGEFGAADRVKFIGRVAEADLAAVYKQAGLFVYPSLMEGFGLPVLEAMAMGIPVVCANAGALTEVAGEAALLINPERVEEITQAMELVLNHEGLAQGLREKGFKRVQQFSWDLAARQTLETLIMVK